MPTRNRRLPSRHENRTINPLQTCQRLLFSLVIFAASYSFTAASNSPSCSHILQATKCLVIIVVVAIAIIIAAAIVVVSVIVAIAITIAAVVVVIYVVVAIAIMLHLHLHLKQTRGAWIRTCSVNTSLAKASVKAWFYHFISMERAKAAMTRELRCTHHVVVTVVTIGELLFCSIGTAVEALS
jgi:hypothetical protein